MYVRQLSRFCFTNSQLLKKFAEQPNQEPFHPIKPRQHPKNPLSTNNQIYEAKKATRYLNEARTVPKSIYVSPLSLNEFDTQKYPDQSIAKNIFTKGQTPNPPPEEQKFMRAVIVGPPNAGKSSIMNYLVNDELSAVSNKSNTTSEAIVGIHTNYERRVQIEFKDLPGISKRYKYSQHFVTKAWNELNQTNLIMFTVDAVKTLEDTTKEALKRLNTLQKQLIQSQEMIEEPFVGKILLLNKIDLCFNKRKLKWLLTELEDLTKFDRIFHISAATGYGFDNLKEYLYQNAFDKDWEYPDNIVTTLQPIDKIEQAAKSAIFKRFYREIPFTTTINLDEFRTLSDGSANLKFLLNVQSDNQQRMIIGEKGRNLKILANEVALQMAKSYDKLFQISFEVLVKRGDSAQLVEQRKEIESFEVVQGQSQSASQQIYEFQQLQQRREKIAYKLREYIGQ